MSRRLEKLDPERQRRLFDVAAQEFAAHGFESASLNRILERSGMSKSSLYYYFDDKADLFTTMIARALGVLFREIGAPDPASLQGPDFWDSYETLYRRALEVIERHAWLVRFGGMFYQLRQTPAGASTGSLFVAARHWLATQLEQGQALGVVRRDLPQSLLLDMAMALVETLDRWVVAHWDSLSPPERAALPAQHMALFRDLLGVVPPVQPQG